MDQKSEATRVFFQTVHEHMEVPPARLSPEDSIRDVVGYLSTHKCSAVVLTDTEDRPRGIVTEQDIARRIAFRADENQPASDLMSYPLRTVQESEPLYVALATMRRYGHRHLPVVTRNGKYSGLLDVHQVMVAAAGDLVSRVETFAYDRTRDGLRETKVAALDLAADLLDEGVAAPEIQELLTHINNSVYHDLLEINAADMEQEGKGSAPLEFCMVIMGSGGRGENYLSPDQDYGFIIGDCDEEVFNQIDGWFLDLAERLSKDLDTAGLPFCKGNVMATNPQWRQSLSGWKDQVDSWNAATSNQAFLDFDIFFDFTPVLGKHLLGQSLREYVTDVMKRNEPFLRRLFAADRSHRTAMRSFGRWLTSKEPGPKRGKMDLKIHGSFPLVQCIRLLSLREGVQSTSTLGRMSALKELDQINPTDFDELTNAYNQLSTLILTKQVMAAKAGSTPSYFVDPKSLSRLERRRLRESLGAVENLLTRIRFEFGGEVY